RLDPGAFGAGTLARALFDGLPEDAAPDVVVTALGRSEFAGALLRRAGAFAIHIGAPIHLPAEAFDLLVLTEDEAVRTNVAQARTPIAPTPILRADMGPLADDPVWCALIGGDTEGYAYAADDWDRLAHGLDRLARGAPARLRLTTSRRTGAEGEARLKAVLAPSPALVEAVWHGEAPRPVVGAFLKPSRAAFCTEDSRSMIAVAIAAGRPVYALRPERTAPEPRHAAYLARQEAARRLRRVALGELDGIDVERDVQDWFRPLEACWSETLIETLFAHPAFQVRLPAAD
ncbi:ELM1/GtrOC1 family putative glycosyltransferase, partial [Methylopila musalis]